MASTQGAPTRLSLRARRAIVLCIAVSSLAACGSSASPAPAPAAPASVPPDPPAARLGEIRDVNIVQGVQEVPARVVVYSFRDHVAADPAIRPLAPKTHWSSADLQVCSARPVELAFFAWVVADDVGRSASAAQVSHHQFPRPAFPIAASVSGCRRGWVTFPNPDDLVATNIAFGQVKGPLVRWRVRG